MNTPQKRQQLAALAEEVFELGKLGSRMRAAARTDESASTLTETETLALDLLSKQGEMTVGEIQKGIGVLPAQMSRIIRALMVLNSGKRSSSTPNWYISERSRNSPPRGRIRSETCSESSA